MERVTDLYPEKPYKTRVWITDVARKELEDIVNPDLMALFETRATGGFHDYNGPWLRREGDGVWGFGTKSWTIRIAGYFLNDMKRDHFIIGGAWKGKRGSGNNRPPRGDEVAERVALLKKNGVIFVQ